MRNDNPERRVHSEARLLSCPTGEKPAIAALCYNRRALRDASEGFLTAVTALTIVLLLAAIVVCAAAVWMTREIVCAARSVRVLSDDVHERVVPLLDKADITVDAANAELLRVDSAITRFEEASLRVSAASGTLSEFVQAPAEIVSSVAERVRRRWKERRQHVTDASLAQPELPADGDRSSEFDDNEVVVAEMPATERRDEDAENEGLHSAEKNMTETDEYRPEDPWARIE
jgi:hypothetical protein